MPDYWTRNQNCSDMDVEYCKAKKCAALNEKRTRGGGTMYRCFHTTRNQTIRNVESCEEEEMFGINEPKLKSDCAFERNKRKKYNTANNER